MRHQIQIIKATLEDAEELTRASRISFDDDTSTYGMGTSGGPPGYDKVEKQKFWIKTTNYYKFVLDNKIVGGMFLKSGLEFDRPSSADNYYLIRLFILPDFQNQGIGTIALKFIEHEFPQAKKWTLDTPHWAIRNHHFYEKMGYVKIREDKITARFTAYLYEKKMP